MAQNILAQLARVSLLVEMNANCRASTFVLLLSFCLRLARDTRGTLELSKYQMFSAEACDSAEGAQLLNTKQREDGEKEAQQRPISRLQTIRVTGNS